MGITKKQHGVLEFIRDFILQYHYSPTVREIAAHFKISVSTAHQHLKALQAKGYIEMASGEQRSIELTQVPDNQFDIAEIVNLPLMGLIAAGEPIEAVENPEPVAIPARLLRDQRNSYVLQVRGNSMIEDGILDGDFVVVERNPSPQDGDTVVALLDNAYATLKKFYREKGRIRLQPANKTLKPIYVKDPLIQGIVRAVIRNYQTI